MDSSTQDRGTERGAENPLKDVRKLFQNDDARDESRGLSQGSPEGKGEGRSRETELNAGPWWWFGCERGHKTRPLGERPACCVLH